MSNESLKFALAAAVGAGFSLTHGIRVWRRKRFLENIPSSKVRSAAMGLVELSGIAQHYQPQLSPLSNQPCCWWRYIVQEYRRSGKNSHWVTVKDCSSYAPFFLEDATGKVLIDPHEAEMHITLRETYDRLSTFHAPALLEAIGVFPNWLGGYSNIRVIEEVIPNTSPLYVVGELSQRFLENATDRQERFRTRLRSLKSDAQRMAEADTNHDGKVDAAEWDAAREKEYQRFLEEDHRAIDCIPANERLVVKTTDHGFFIISTIGEDELCGRWAWTGPGAIVLGVGLIGVCVWLLQNM